MTSRTRSTRSLRLAPTAALLALAVGLGGCADQPEPVVDEAPEVPGADPSAVDPTMEMDIVGVDGAFVSPAEATREELLAIEGVDEATADALIAGRPYENMLQVDSVLMGTLDEAQREEAYRTLWMPLDLNEAQPEEIQLIPGVGDRMTGEFLEYRPYDAIERFRREIGKYVDEQEVARLEQYVEIR